MTKTLNQLTEITALADDDLLLARDTSAVEDKKIQRSNLASQIISDHTGEADPHTQYAELSGGAAANFSTAPQVSGSEIYAKSTVVGTASQSAGVPTGAVIESGSNLEGDYTKFADGTLICRMTGVSTGPIDDATQGGYTTAPILKNYPHEFVSGLVSVSISTTQAVSTLGISDNNTRCRFFLWAGDVQFSATRNVTITAIGRWY